LLVRKCSGVHADLGFTAGMEGFAGSEGAVAPAKRSAASTGTWVKDETFGEVGGSIDTGQIP
jgi:hypothetical protein